MTSNNSSRSLFSRIVQAIIIFVFICGVVQCGIWINRVYYMTKSVSTLETSRKLSYAVEYFKKRYGALPGDLPNAGKILKGCPGIDGEACNPLPQYAGDGIVGTADVLKAIKAQSLPFLQRASSAEDETRLFWMHLFYADLLSPVTTGFDIQSSANYSSRLGGKFVIAHLDDESFPKGLRPEGAKMSGLSLLIIGDDVLNDSSKLTNPSTLPLTPFDGQVLDQGKFDDRKPDSGYLQAYGTADCFIEKPDKYYRYIYNVDLDEKACGFIFKITN